MKKAVLILSFLFSLQTFADALSTLKPDSHCDLDLEYSYYKVCYSVEHLQAFWTFHILSTDNIKGPQRRTNDFRKDRNVYYSVGKRDYKGSGFDRGHLVPAGDMKLNRTSMSETFYMTNMTPQRSGFNSGVWRALEEGIRKDVLKYGTAFVVTGPVLSPFTDYNRIKSGVSIPEEFFKAVYFVEAEFMKAYLIPNFSQKGRSFKTFRLSVDELEQVTGYDFFKGLDDEYENRLESAF